MKDWKFQQIWKSLPNEKPTLRDSCYLVTVGFIVGLVAGIIISLFRIVTDYGYKFALNITGENRTFLVILGWFILASAAAWCVGRLIRNPAIRSGGSEWLMKAINSPQPHAWRKILIPKFIGTSLVMAFGISVGREGPSIQMGAASALGLSRYNNKDKIERRFFVIGGAAAGLSAAFSAPFAGICYIYEVMKEKMSPDLFVFLLAGSFGVYIACDQIFGLMFLLPIKYAPLPDLGQFWILAPVAIFGAISGVAYNYLIRLSCAIYDAQKRFSPLYLPFFAFLGSGVMFFCYPALTGEGMTIFPTIEAGKTTAQYLLLFLIAKLIFTAYCYGSLIPAGLMVPVLCIGGVSGVIYADILISSGMMDPAFFATCLVTGMACSLCAAEQAPLTGLVLVCQMTGAYSACLGMLFAVSLAYWLSKIARTKDM